MTGVQTCALPILAAQRRALPPGPMVEKNYRFHDANGLEVGLIDLFGDKDTLVTYFWMYGPQRERPCPMCTNWLGAVNGNANDIAQRVSLKILGRSPVERQLAFAQERGWKHLDFVQTASDDYANDLGLRNADGTENPALRVFFLQRLAERARYGDHVQQRHAGLELGVEHDGAVDITDRPVRRALEHIHHAGEMQHQPHRQHAARQRDAGPAVKTIGQRHGGDS